MLYIIGPTVLIALFSCSKKSNEDSKAHPQSGLLSTDAKRLTEKAYDLKQVGKNGEALSLLETAARKIEKAEGKNSEAYASNLDDRATIHLRMGNPQKAALLYHQAENILQETDQIATRLFAGIRRRLATMDALKALGVVCKEPLDATSIAKPESSLFDGGVSAAKEIPYFPRVEDLQKAFSVFNLEMKGCVDVLQDALPVWTVITGDGRIALCSVKSEDIDEKIRICLEKKMMEVSSRHAGLLPKFRACFRNFTYPLAFRK